MSLYSGFFGTHRWLVWFSLLLTLFVMACSQDNKPITVEIFKVVVLPDRHESQLRSKYQPLLDHLKSQADLNTELLFQKSYNELQKIFEPLYSTKSFGVGLGLPTVKQIMEQHGDGIEIDSEEGKGAIVTLWFPEGINKGTEI